MTILFVLLSKENSFSCQSFFSQKNFINVACYHKKYWNHEVNNKRMIKHKASFIGIVILSIILYIIATNVTLKVHIMIHTRIIQLILGNEYRSTSAIIEFYQWFRYIK